MADRSGLDANGSRSRDFDYGDLSCMVCESQQAAVAEPDCRNYTQTIKVEREDPFVVKRGRVCREDDGNWRIVE